MLLTVALKLSFLLEVTSVFLKINFLFYLCIMSFRPFSRGLIKRENGDYSFQSRRPSYAEVVRCGSGKDLIWTKARWLRYMSFRVLSGTSMITPFSVLDIYHFQRRAGLLISFYFYLEILEVFSCNFYLCY